MLSTTQLEEYLDKIDDREMLTVNELLVIVARLRHDISELEDTIGELEATIEELDQEKEEQAKADPLSMAFQNATDLEIAEALFERSDLTPWHYARIAAYVETL